MSSRFAVSSAALISPLTSAIFSGLLSILVLGLILGSTPGVSAAQEKPITPEYKKTLKTLIEVTGATSAGEQIAYAVAQETLGQIAATGTPVTEQVQKIVVDEALADFVPRFSDLDILTDLYAPYYHEHLTQAELQELLDFYKSPLGTKILTALPAIAQGGATALQQAGLERLPAFQTEVDKKLREAGIVVSP